MSKMAKRKKQLLIASKFMMFDKYNQKGRINEQDS